MIPLFLSFSELSLALIIKNHIKSLAQRDLFLQERQRGREQLKETSEILPTTLLTWKLISLDSSSKTKCANQKWRHGRVQNKSTALLSLPREMPLWFGKLHWNNHSLLGFGNLTWCRFVLKSSTGRKSNSKIIPAFKPLELLENKYNAWFLFHILILAKDSSGDKRRLLLFFLWNV